MTLVTHRAQPPRANMFGVSATYPAAAIWLLIDCLSGP